MQIAIGMPTGYPSASARAGGIFDALLNDTFTTNRSAGALSGTAPEPGPGGERGVIDTNSKLSSSGGQLVGVTGGAGNFDPALIYQRPIARSPGQCLLTTVNVSANRVQFGGTAAATLTTAALTSGRRGSFDLNGTTLAVAPGSSGSVTVGVAVLSTTYQLCISFRASGAWYFIKGGAFTNWTLLWIDTAAFNSTMYPYIASLGTTTAFVADEIVAPAKRFAPAPLASDGFSAWGATDGLGHPEGVVGGLGSGGSGLAWQSAIGAWDALDGLVICNTSGGVAAATIDTGVTDAIVTAKVTRSGGVAGALVAYVDSNNLIRAVHNGTNALLVKRVGGSDTNVISAAATYVAGADIRVIREGTAYRLFYNNAAVGSVQTISDAVFNGVTVQGLYSSDDNNSFDDFRVYARGAAGEYADIDDL